MLSITNVMLPAPALPAPVLYAKMHGGGNWNNENQEAEDSYSSFKAFLVLGWACQLSDVFLCVYF